MSYFTIEELTRSATAKARGIDNTPDAVSVKNLHLLIANVLDPLREAWGRPLTVNSGYRSPALNKAVGGVSTSQHTKGQAADITAGTMADNLRLARLVRSLKLPFDQLIIERGGQWLHISHKSSGNRGQVLNL